MENTFEPSDYRRLSSHAVPCACCGCRTSVTAVEGDRYGFGLTTVVCSKCGLIFTNPRPTDEWFNEFYRLHYRKYYESITVPDEEYLNRDWIKGRHSRNVELLTPLLEIKGRVLDIGCAEGSFLNLFRRQFPCWDFHGVEPSEDFAAFAMDRYKLLSVVPGKFEELENLYGAESFDLITASHVLEHLLSPNRFFEVVHRLLKPRGLLFIDVPDAEGQSHGIGNIHIGHVYHYSARSLDNFLGKHGFAKMISQKGCEMPHQWTFQVLARKRIETAKWWEPPLVDVDIIARNFAQHCRRPWRGRWTQLLTPLRRRWHPLVMGSPLLSAEQLNLWI